MFQFLNNLYIKRTKTSFIVMVNMFIWVIREWKLIFESKNLYADVACNGGYEEMRKLIKEKSELPTPEQVEELYNGGDFYSHICYFRYSWTIRHVHGVA